MTASLKSDTLNKRTVAWLRIGRGHGKGLRYYLICWECAEILADEVLHPGSSLHAGGGQ